MRLYVRSQKTDVVSHDIVRTGNAIDRMRFGLSRSELTGYTPEDEEVLTSLRSEGVEFSLVDLSECPFGSRLKARVNGIKKTPTLVSDDGKKIEGASRIKDYISVMARREKEGKLD